MWRSLVQPEMHISEATERIWSYTCFPLLPSACNALVHIPGKGQYSINDKVPESVLQWTTYVLQIALSTILYQLPHQTPSGFGSVLCCRGGHLQNGPEGRY